MDFVKDLRIIAEKFLDRYGLSYSPIEDTEAILRRWVNTQLKLIQPFPRKVCVSDKIRASTYDENINLALSVIKNKFIKGLDVNGHLSKSIFYEDDTDYLFSDWGIYHLHLNTEPDDRNPYFVKRKKANDLLFLMIRGENVYLIDIRKHNENYVFAQKELLQIINDNWPEIIEPHRLRGISAGEEISNPEKIHMLRKKMKVNIMHAIGDKVIAPMGGGLTGAGSINVTIETDRLLLIAREAEKWTRENEEKIKREIQRVYPNQDKFDFHLEVDDNSFCIVEAISKTVWGTCSFPWTNVKSSS